MYLSLSVSYDFSVSPLYFFSFFCFSSFSSPVLFLSDSCVHVHILNAAVFHCVAAQHPFQLKTCFFQHAAGSCIISKRFRKYPDDVCLLKDIFADLADRFCGEAFSPNRTLRDNSRARLSGNECFRSGQLICFRSAFHLPQWQRQCSDRDRRRASLTEIPSRLLPHKGTEYHPARLSCTFLLLMSSASTGASASVHALSLTAIFHFLLLFF